MNLAAKMEEDGVRLFSGTTPLLKRLAFLDAVSSNASDKAADAWASIFSNEYPRERDEWTRFRSAVLSYRRYIFDEFGDYLRHLLGSSNPCFLQKVNGSHTFYRARIHGRGQEKRALSAAELGAPRSELATAGRANASGIPVLYAADSGDTAVAEVRPFVGAIVSIAACRPKKKLRVFDLSRKPNLGSLDPCANDFRFEVEAARLGNALNIEFSNPISPYTPERDYAPTQIVAEMISKNGYDGIRYRSAMNVAGSNYVFFRPARFTIECVETVRVTGLAVEHAPYDPQWLKHARLDALSAINEAYQESQPK